MQFLKTSGSNLVCLHTVDRVGVIRIATGYRLYDPGIEFRWGQEFPSRPTLGPTKRSVQWVPGLLPGSKSGWGVGLTTHPVYRWG